LLGRGDAAGQVEVDAPAEFFVARERGVRDAGLFHHPEQVLVDQVAPRHLLRAGADVGETGGNAARQIADLLVGAGGLELVLGVLVAEVVGLLRRGRGVALRRRQ
jgi:hypothetical protein